MTAEKRRPRTSRTERGGWGSKGTLRLGERDLAVLHAVGLLGIATAKLISDLVFADSPGYAPDRLRQLVCHGLLNCFVPAVNTSNIYTLNAKGLDALESAGSADPRLRIVREPPARLDHALGVAATRVALAIACGSGAWRLSSFRPEHELAAERTATRCPILPDAMIRLERADGAVKDLALEVDLGTEAPAWLGKKLAAYGRYALSRVPLYGALAPCVLVLAPSGRRLTILARAVMRVGALGEILLGNLDRVDAATVLGASYAAPADLAVGAGFRHSLV